MLNRYASAASSSALVTISLLFVMQQLIALQPGAELDPRPRMELPLYVMETDETPLQLREEIFHKDLLTKTEVEPPHTPYTGAEETIRVPRVKPPAPTETRLPPLGQFADGPLVAMVRVKPVYPARALARGIEGFVVVEFDITSTGHVANAVVIDTSDSVFNRAALKAAAQFKFKPRIVDGVALESYGTQNLFRFSLDEN